MPQTALLPNWVSSPNKITTSIRSATTASINPNWAILPLPAPTPSTTRCQRKWQMNPSLRSKPFTRRNSLYKVKLAATQTSLSSRRCISRTEWQLSSRTYSARSTITKVSWKRPTRTNANKTCQSGPKKLQSHHLSKRSSWLWIRRLIKSRRRKRDADPNFRQAVVTNTRTKLKICRLWSQRSSARFIP